MDSAKNFKNIINTDYANSNQTISDDNGQDFLSRALQLHRVPPYSIAAEQAFLGAILYNNNVYEEVSDFLRPEHFADSIHSKIYYTIMALIEEGKPADVITLNKNFEREEVLQNLGGTKYLNSLVENIVSVLNAKEYARNIYDLYIRRRLLDIADEISHRVHTYSIENDAFKQVEQVEESLFCLMTNRVSEAETCSMTFAMSSTLQLIESFYNNQSNSTELKTGFEDLDRSLGNLRKSQLLILAGRPSMGKTALATNIAFNIASQGKKICFFSLEMPKEEILTRLIAQEVEIPSNNILSDKLTEAGFSKVFKASKKIRELSFFINDAAALTVSAIRTKARRLKRQQGLDLIIIDYLQLIEPSYKKNSLENRAQELAEITRGLKALAKDLAVPVIVLSQLSRAVEQREDRRPQLSDLRDSGAIEQDADTVMFVYREEYYLERKEPSQSNIEKHEDWEKKIQECKNIAEINIAKQRNGSIGTVKLCFDSRLTKFSNLKK